MPTNNATQSYRTAACRSPYIPPNGGLGGAASGSLCLLSTAYFPPIQWFQKLFRHEKALIERFDNYTKQTYRNRCIIATANGRQSLTVPVERYEGDKCLMRDIRISSHGNWTHLHLHALMSAYGESPFFDYYIDDLRPFFEKPQTFLYDHNLAIVEKLCELLDTDFNAEPTDRFEPPMPLVSDGEGDVMNRVSTLKSSAKSTESDGVETRFIASQSPQDNTEMCFTRSTGTEIADYRDVIRPKKPLPDLEFQPKPYYQVYALRNGFQPNLSILDLLFNEGPEAVLYL